MTRLWSLLLGSALIASASAPDGFLGSQACDGCHAAISASHAGSAHGGALMEAAGHPAASKLAGLGNAMPSPGVALRFYRTPNQLRARVMSGGEQTDLEVDWVFGAGGQAVTLVSHLGAGSYLEHGFSYFGGDRLARTPGHSATPRTLNEAIGLVYPIDGPNGIRSCFQCHSTGGVEFAPDGSATVAEAGVGCEACHGPGRDHLAERARIEAGSVSPSRQIELCGRCHRLPQPSGRVDWDDPWNVRHAPVYLAESRCFQGGAVGCTSCHDPHASLARADGARYAAVCLGCHTAAHAGRATHADCVGCHMPKVRPHEHLRFTNHWIGVYVDQNPLRPIGR